MMEETQKTVRERVVEVILDHVDPDHHLRASEILDDTKIEDLGDSLDSIELIMELEEEFDDKKGQTFKISDEESEKIRTVEDAISCVERLYKQDAKSDAE